MPSFKTKIESITVDGVEYRLKTLLNRSRFSDQRDEARDLGIHSNEWSYFGMVWPAAHILAQEISRYALDGLRVLEVGCGIGLASLVAQKRMMDITANDFHPLAEEFLIENARLNELPPITYRDGDWSNQELSLGQFDLVIGSDVIYDRRHPCQLSSFIDRQLAPQGEVLLAIPRREPCSEFIGEMTEIGFLKTEERFVYPNKEATTCRGRILKFRRECEENREL